MEELNRMIRKMKVENLARYLMYDVEVDVEETADYEQDLKESYEIFFQKLEDMYPEASRQDDELFRLVTDFAVKHENISFKAGMFIGFQIYKNMEEGYRGHTDSSLSVLASFLKEEIEEKLLFTGWGNIVEYICTVALIIDRATVLFIVK
jgi:hypothetical protein